MSVVRPLRAPLTQWKQRNWPALEKARTSTRPVPLPAPNLAISQCGLRDSLQHNMCDRPPLCHKTKNRRRETGEDKATVFSRNFGTGKWPAAG